MIVKCSKCGIEFKKGSNGSQWNWCRDCTHKCKIDWIKAHPYPKDGKIIHCSECGAEFARGIAGSNHYQCSKCVKIYHKNRTKNESLILLQHYSGKEIPECKICGFNDIRALEIDHINNDGAEHRKNIGPNVRHWLKKNNYPDGYQVLCSSCNRVKAKQFLLSKNPNPTPRQIIQRKFYIKLKLNVFCHYSYGIPHCAYCGEINMDKLTIDHIDGGGNKHRLKITTDINKWLKSHGFPPGYQVLCCNCNTIKEYNRRCGENSV